LPETLDRLISGVRVTRRLQLRRWLVLGGLTLAGLWLVCFLLYAGLDTLLKLSVASRVLTFLLTSCLLILVVRRFWWTPLRRPRPDEAIAADIERGAPQLETSLSTSIEYGEDAEKASIQSSPPIVERLVEQAAERAEDVRFEEAVDWRWPKRIASGAASLGLIALVGIFAAPTLFRPAFHRFVNPLSPVDPPTLARVESVSPGTAEIPFRGAVTVRAAVGGFLPESVYLYRRSFGKDWRRDEMRQAEPGKYAFTVRNVQEDFDYYVLARDHRGPQHTITVYVEPAVESLSATLTYPQYTGMAPMHMATRVGDLRALSGTRVEFEVRTNVPVREGQVLFKTAEAVALYRAEPQLLRGRFVIQTDDHYAIRLVDRKNRTSPNVLWHSIAALEDERPIVKIHEPDPDIMAEQDQEVKVRIEAEDDFGAGEVGVALYVLGEDELRESVKVLKPPLRRTRATYQFDLEQMILPEGAILAYYAYASDNDTVNGPKEGVSVLQFIRVYEKQELAEKEGLESSQQSKNQQAQQKLLANIEKIISDQIRILSNTFRIAGVPSGERTAEDGKSLTGMGKKEKQLAGQVEKIADTMEEALKRMGVEEMPDVDALREAVPSLRNAGWFLEFESAISALEPEKAALHQLSKARRLIQSLSKTGNRQSAAFFAVSEQQKRQRQQRNERSQEMQEMAKEMPKLLERQKKVKRELERLAKKEEQERTKDEPERPDDWETYRKREEVKDEMRDMLDEAFDMARRMSDQARDDARMSERTAERMKDAVNKAFQAQTALSFREYKTALERAREAEKKMRQAELGLHNAMRRDLSEAMRSAADRARELAQRQEQIQKQAEQRARQGAAPSTPPSGQEPSGQSLSGQQRDLERETRALGEDLHDLARSASQSGRDADKEALGKAAERLRSGTAPESMKRAAEELEAGRAAQAVPHQQKAGESLREVHSELDQAVARAKTEEDEELRKLLEDTRRLAGGQRKLNREMAVGESEAKDLASRQSEKAKAAGGLADKARKLSLLSESGLEEETHSALSAASLEMKESTKKIREGKNELAKSHGDEAVQQLEAAAENLRAARERSLGRRLAELASAAEVAAKQQRRVEDALRTMAEDTPEGEKAPRWRQRSAAQSQEQAAQQARQLESGLELSSKVAEKTEPWVAQDLNRVLDSMKARKLLPESKKLAEALSPAQKQMDAGSASAGQKQAASLASALEDASRKLETLKNDYLATPLERLQSAQKSASEVVEGLEELERHSREAKTKSGTDPAPDTARKQQMEALNEKLDRLAQQLQRTDSQAAAERQSLQRAREAQAAAEKAMIANDSDLASGYLTAEREHLQVVREGILERIQRILRKRDIKEPGSEHVPAEFQELVKQYYRVLSEEK